ncbi:hypothetical protein ASD40_33565 [Paenibacillus sp. Root444D2]|nr:hypothetical protein ASD40_33565 [Paenibacillus sp. Root444D2]KRE41236.1 hypothetical protein ASG85_34230 [Paenibacillus sp. Soil724D2]
MAEIHAAQATNFRGIILAKRHLSFTNDLEGFERLQRWMDELQQKHRLNTLIIGMEPTGHYWFILANRQPVQFTGNRDGLHIACSQTKKRFVRAIGSVHFRFTLTRSFGVEGF